MKKVSTIALKFSRDRFAIRMFALLVESKMQLRIFMEKHSSCGDHVQINIHFRNLIDLPRTDAVEENLQYYLRLIGDLMD